MDDKKVKLRVAGLSVKSIKSEVYILLLADECGHVYLPMAIGAAEARAIAMKLEGKHPSRPMTCDLFNSFAHAFGVRLDEVFIHDYEQGVFHTEMTFTDGERQVVLDARTSDAIAVALRAGAPIYIDRALLDVVGYEMDAAPSYLDDIDINTYDVEKNKEFVEQLSVSELNMLMEAFVDNEKYEQAARLDEIIARKGKPGDTPDIKR